MTSLHPSHILGDPAWLLAGFDAARREWSFVETTRGVLTASAFIDGRTPLSPSGRHARIPLAVSNAWLAEAQSNSKVDRFVGHVGFCGSSLVARALDA